MKRLLVILVATLLGSLQVPATAPAGERAKKIVFLAGRPSHGYGAHEHYAGCRLLANYLQQTVADVHTMVCRQGWPEDPATLEDADTIVVFSNGGGSEPLVAHLDQFAPLMARGVGLACLHYTLDVPVGRPGDLLRSWLGGCYEQHWSVNPHWDARFTQLPDHPVTRGVQPFSVADEWYYHMRFVEGMRNVTPILSAIPPDATRQRPDGRHSGNPAVRARLGQAEHVAWVYERPGGGRGFGFTGGHHHWNWRNNGFRTIVLNGIAWTAGIDIPAQGLVTPPPTWQQLAANQDYPQPPDFDKDRWLKLFQRWDRP